VIKKIVWIKARIKNNKYSNYKKCLLPVSCHQHHGEYRLNYPSLPRLPFGKFKRFLDILDDKNEEKLLNI